MDFYLLNKKYGSKNNYKVFNYEYIYNCCSGLQVFGIFNYLFILVKCKKIYIYFCI